MIFNIKKLKDVESGIYFLNVTKQKRQKYSRLLLKIMKEKLEII